MALTTLHAACALLATLPVFAQETQPQAKDENSPKTLNDLTTRFRLHEKYVVDDARKPSRGEISQYRVGVKETFRTSAEQPQGAPQRAEAGRRMIYDERPSRVSSLDPRRVTDVVRRYVGVRMDPETAHRAADDPKPFDNLTVWIHTLPGDSPQIVVLTPGRELFDKEYIVAAEQTFVPDLAFTLPDLPVRIGESWSVARTGASTLAGREVVRGMLTGKLLSVRVDDVANKRTAVIDIQGIVTSNIGVGPIHAELEFTFDAPAPPPGGANAGEAEGKAAIVDAVGMIQRVSLAQEIVGPAPRPNERLKITTSRELILERREKSADAPELSPPKEPPAATVENSWLTHVDPAGRFSFRHPQGMRVMPPPPDATVYLLNPRTGGADFLFLSLVPRADLNPDAFQKAVTADLETKGVEIVPGQSEWLPEAEWPKMKVHRTSVAMMPKGRNTVGGPRFHEFDYIVQTGRDQGLQVRATTNSDPPTSFRQEVESMLKTFQFGAPAQATP
jgi:hypothetical protein